MSEHCASTLSEAYQITSRRIAHGVSLLAVAATPVIAQTGSFQPTRCVRDTTTALSATAEISTTDSVSAGIRYRCLYVPRGPWALHVVSIDLRDRRYAIDGIRALGARLGREKVSEMARRLALQSDTPIVVINADFFNLQTGEVENNTVIRGEWVKGVVLSDSPHDSFDNAHTQFAVDDGGRPLIGRFELHGEVTSGASREPLLGINYRSSRDSGIVLYTPWYGAQTPRDSTTQQVTELEIERLRSAGVETTYRIRPASLTQGGGAPIPREGAVLSASGAAVAFLRNIAQDSGTLRVAARLGEHAVAPRTVVGGWPRLIVDGRNVGALTDSVEGTFPRFSSARHPRSAIAISRDSSTLMLVVVDGRRPWSVGMSLAELADQLLALGAYQAMNLDGGGSSTLWVRGTIVNYPSDVTGERAVGNALIVVKRPSP